MMSLTIAHGKYPEFEPVIGAGLHLLYVRARGSRLDCAPETLSTNSRLTCTTARSRSSLGMLARDFFSLDTGKHSGRFLNILRDRKKPSALYPDYAELDTFAQIAGSRPWVFCQQYK